MPSMTALHWQIKPPARGLTFLTGLCIGKIAVVVFPGKCYILPEPGRRGEGEGILFIREFDFHKKQRGKMSLEDVKLCRKPAV